ncbi:MAG: insulinase family protein [Thermoanaerobaculales bacterium]|nr:insulinase family protein [Thermoanaerobaculales bacterium]
MSLRRHRVIAGLAMAALLGALPVAAQEAKVPVQEFILDNGMKLVMVERHESPTVSAGWVTHVGSVNEEAGATGIAHLFEHMIFKGSRTIGTSDYAKESEIMARLDAIRLEMEAEYEVMREMKRRGEIAGSIYLIENQTPRLAELRARMKALEEEQKQLIVKDEFDQIYTEAGASGLNAGTSNDFTVYFITVPANKLELWFWMESERLLNAVFREFYSERDVVREERRMRVESDPTAKFDEQFDFMFWGSLPYHHPVVGWPSDVESITLAQARSFFATYYAPNNITAALVGDFDTEQALALAKKYFGRIPRGAVPPPPVVTEEIEQLAERRMAAEAETNPSVQVRWHAVPFAHKDAAALDVLDSILNGRTGRLYKSLVEEKQLATGEPSSSFSAMKYGGYLEVGAELAEGADHRQVEEALLAEIERLQKEPVGERELQKVKNQSLADSYRRLQSNFFLLLQLMLYDVWDDWRYLNDSPARIQAVTPEDLQRVATTYLTPTGRNVLWYSRKAGTDEDPELGALSAQGKAMAKQALAQINQLSDPAELEQGIAQLQAMAGQAPPEYKPAIELVIKRANERLAELQAAAGKEQ